MISSGIAHVNSLHRILTFSFKHEMFYSLKVGAGELAITFFKNKLTVGNYRSEFSKLMVAYV